MKLKGVLTVSAIYLAVLGVGFMFFATADRFRCRSGGCLPGADRLSQDFRRSHSWDCSVELDGSECGALCGA